MDQFRVGEVKDLGAGEDVLFQNTGITMQIMFKFGSELLLLFSSLHIYKYFGSAHAFSLFSLG